MSSWLHILSEVASIDDIDSSIIEMQFGNRISTALTIWIHLVTAVTVTTKTPSHPESVGSVHWSYITLSWPSGFKEQVDGRWSTVFAEQPSLREQHLRKRFLGNSCKLFRTCCQKYRANIVELPICNPSSRASPTNLGLRNHKHSMTKQRCNSGNEVWLRANLSDLSGGSAWSTARVGTSDHPTKSAKDGQGVCRIEHQFQHLLCLWWPAAAQQVPRATAHLHLCRFQSMTLEIFPQHCCIAHPIYPLIIIDPANCHTSSGRIGPELAEAELTVRCPANTRPPGPIVHLQALWRPEFQQAKDVVSQRLSLSTKLPNALGEKNLLKQWMIAYLRVSDQKSR